MAHYDLLQNIKVRGIEGFKELLMQSFFETQDRDLVGRLMPSVMGEEVKVEPNTAYDSIAFGFCLKQHSSLQHLEVELPRGGVVVEVQRLLKPCLCHWQLQTLTIFDHSASSEDWRQVEDLFDRIRNCDGALKGHFGKVHLVYPPLSVVVKLLCLQHVREVECFEIHGYEAMDHEVLKEMEKALGENKTLQKLTLSVVNAMYSSDDADKTVPKEFCCHLMIGIGRNTSLSEVYLSFAPITWYCPIDVPADIHGSVQHVTLGGVPVDVLPRLFLWFSQAKHFECHYIHPPQEAMDHEVLKEMEKALGENMALETLRLYDDVPRDVPLPKEFCRHVLLGIRLNKSLSEVNLNFKPINWDCPSDVPADIHGSVQHVTLGGVPVDMLPKLFLWFSQVKHLECTSIYPPQEAIDQEVLKEMEKTLGENKTLETLRYSDGNNVTGVVPLPKEFCRHLMIGIGRSKSLSEVNLDFAPINWVCLNDVPADIHGSVQHVTLGGVPVDMLPKLFLWFSQVKHLECTSIYPPQEDGVGKRDVKFTEVEQTLSGMGRLEKLVLGIDDGMSDALMVEFGVFVIKGISGNRHTTHFVLYDQHRKIHLLRSIMDRLPTDVERHFIIDKYTVESGVTYPCISHSASGHPTLPWAPPQHFHPRPAYPHLSAVGYDTHSVRQHQVPPPPRWPPLPTPQPFDPGWMVPSAMALHPHQVPYTVGPVNPPLGYPYPPPPQGWFPPHQVPPRWASFPSPHHFNPSQTAPSPVALHPLQGHQVPPAPAVSHEQQYHTRPHQRGRGHRRGFHTHSIHVPHPSSSPRHEPRPSSSPRREPRPSSSTFRHEHLPSNSTFRHEPHPSSTPRREPRPSSSTFRHEPRPSSSPRREPCPSSSTFSHEPHPYSTSFRHEPHPLRHGPRPTNPSPFPPGDQDVTTTPIPPELVDQFSVMYSYSQWGNPPVPPQDQD